MYVSYFSTSSSFYTCTQIIKLYVYQTLFFRRTFILDNCKTRSLNVHLCYNSDSVSVTFDMTNRHMTSCKVTWQRHFMGYWIMDMWTMTRQLMTSHHITPTHACHQLLIFFFNYLLHVASLLEDWSNFSWKKLLQFQNAAGGIETSTFRSKVRCFNHPNTTIQATKQM